MREIHFCEWSRDIQHLVIGHTVFGRVILQYSVINYPAFGLGVFYVIGTRPDYIKQYYLIFYSRNSRC